MIENKLKSNNAIDLGKFISSLFILSLHTYPLSSYSKLLEFALNGVVCIVAVPYFFITSSFFLFRKIKSNPEHEKIIFKKNFNRLLELYLIWSAIYFIFVVIDWIKYDKVSIKTILLYIRDLIFVGSYGTIWYLLALLVSITLVYYLKKHLSIEKVLIISFFFYIIALLGHSYYGISLKVPLLKNFYAIYFKYFETVKNGLLFGFFYVSLGAWITEKDIKKDYKKYFIYSIIFYILLFVEAFICEIFDLALNGRQLRFFLIPLSASLFLWLYSINLKDKKTYRYLRDLSVLMFLTQRIFLYILPLLFNKFGILNLYNNSLFRFLLVTLITMVFSITIMKLEKYKMFYFLQRIH